MTDHKLPIVTYTPEEESYLASLVERFYAADERRMKILDELSGLAKEIRRCLHLRDEVGWYDAVQSAIQNIGLSRVADLVSTGQTAAAARKEENRD